jgi:hypothetical protein
MAYYSTVENVRVEAGIEGNANILDTEVESYLKRAHAEVLSFVSAKYNVITLAGSNFEGSQAQGYLESAEVMLAAGLLLIRDYGKQSTDTDKDGYKKVAEARAMLSRLYDVKNPMRLIGVDGTEFGNIAISNAGGLLFSSGTEEDENIFSVKDKW